MSMLKLLLPNKDGNKIDILLKKQFFLDCLALVLMIQPHKIF
jgi:hypothetical protein